MPVLCFPNADALRLALAAGIVPPDVARRPVRGATDRHGRLWAEVPADITKDVVTGLTRIGVTIHGLESGPLTHDLSQWAELLPLRPAPALPCGPALIEIGERGLARLTAELARLGAPPQSFHLVPDSDRAWLHVRDIPVSTGLSLATDDRTPGEVYVPQAPRVWVLAGWEHPLGETVTPQADSTLLLHPERGWRVVPGTSARPESATYPLRERSSSWRPGPVSVGQIPIEITVRKVADNHRPESLWLIPGDPRQSLYELARDTGERLLHEFRVAVFRGPGSRTRIALHAVSDKIRPPDLTSGAWGLVAHEELTSLYLPSGHRVRPAIRVRSLARLLGVLPDLTVWVEPDPTVGFQVLRVSSGLFRPVAELVNYVAPVRQLLAADRFGFGPLALPQFSATPDRPAAGAGHDHRTAPTRFPAANTTSTRESTVDGWLGRIRGRFFGGKSGPVRSTPRTSVESPQADPPQGGWVGEMLASPQALLRGNDWSALRGALEQRILNDLPRLAPQERSPVWSELAAVYDALGNPSAASTCWLNATWDNDSASGRVLGNWLRAEARAAKLTLGRTDLEAILGALAPVQAARVAAAYLVWSVAQPSPPADLTVRLPRVMALLDLHEADVPARAVWLAGLAASQLTGGDTLALARRRDRLVRRLTENGPGLDLDAPSFLRFLGTAGGDQWLSAKDWLARVRDPIHRWIGRHTGTGRLQWAGIDPETDATSAYADLLLAWGLSRLGDRTRARDLEAKAAAALSRAATTGVDPAVHRALLAAFRERIRSAEDGRPDRPGLPLAAAAELSRLDDLGRYAVEKLRAHCVVLEPVDLVNPYRGRDLGGFLGRDKLGERLTRLLARPDLAPEPTDVRDVLSEISADPTAITLPRAVFALLEVGPRLDPTSAAITITYASRAVELIPEWVRLSGSGLDPAAAVRRFGTRLITAAAHTAGHLHLPDSFRQVAAAVRSAADSLDAPFVQVVERIAGRFFRTLRRLGLTEDATGLLATLTAGVSPGPRELGLAVGWFAIGNEDAGMKALDAVRGRLIVGSIPDERDRTATAIAYASAVGHAPPRIALGRLEELFQQLGTVARHGATNRYYTLKPLELIDTVVRAVVSDDFALGPEVRGWLDDDEFLIRRRIARDLGAALV